MKVHSRKNTSRKFFTSLAYHLLTKELFLCEVPLMSLIDLANEKSTKTITHLKIFRSVVRGHIRMMIILINVNNPQSC